MKIFYSWQSDTPDRIGKGFIKLALDTAVEQVAGDLDLEEADRPTVDQDTAGVMGSPAIAETIFEKIREAAVVVFDATLVGRAGDGKVLVNSNVMYELGYTHGVHGPDVLLGVMNTHYGGPDNLPFDLQHRRYPLQYDLAPDARREDLREQRANIAREIAKILRLYVEQDGPTAPVFLPTPSTSDAASFWEEGEVLVNASRQNRGHQSDYGFQTGQPLSYLRLWPDRGIPELSGEELSDYKHSAIQPLSARGAGRSWDRNRFGTVAYTNPEDTTTEFNCTQLLKTREIWGVDGTIIRPRPENRETLFIPTTAYEQGMIDSLRVYVAAAFNHFGYGEIAHVEAGMVNAKGYSFAMPSKFVEQMWSPTYEDFSVSGVIRRDDPDSQTDFLLELFEKCFDAGGHPRPKGLHNFPPANAE